MACLHIQLTKGYTINNCKTMNFTNLKSILERFSYPISEEQAWGICYLIALDLKSLPGPWIYRPDNISKSKFTRDDDSSAFPTEAVQINRSGEVKINRKVLSSRFVTNESETCSSTTTDSDSDDMLLRMNMPSNATEYDLIAPLGIMLYNALDYKLSESEERQLSPSLTNLIEVMLDVCEDIPSSDSPCFGDDLSDFPSEFDLDRLTSPPLTPPRRSISSLPSSKLPNLVGLNEVIERCTAHFFDQMINFEDGHIEMVIISHYTNECKGLVNEFYNCNIMLDNLHYKQGLKDWEHIIESLDSRDYELRTSKVVPPESATLPPFTYEESTLDILQSQIKNFKRDQMNHVQTNSHDKPVEKLDPFRQTLENIKNKNYTLKPMSERVLKERPEATRRVSTPHEMLMEQIHQPPRLKEVPPELKRRYTIDLHKMKLQKQYNTPKRYYPPRESNPDVVITEDQLLDNKRQGIVHGRSVSLPYERVNKVASYKVPIQQNLGDESSSTTSGSDPMDSPPWSANYRSSPVYSDATSICSLDYFPPSTLYNDRPSSSASAGMLLEMSSQGHSGSNSSRDTVIINGDDSSYGEGSDHRSEFSFLQNEYSFYQTSPFSSGTICSMGSSHSLGVKEKRRKHRSRIQRPSTAIENESESRSTYACGISRLQELAYVRDIWVQNQLAELADTHPTLYQDTLLGRLCYVCNTRFTWKKWSSHCKLCNRKVCANCKMTKVLPTNFFSCSPTAGDASRKQEGKKFLVCQHCNIFLCNEFNEPIPSSQVLFCPPRF